MKSRVLQVLLVAVVVLVTATVIGCVLSHRKMAGRGEGSNPAQRAAPWRASSHHAAWVADSNSEHSQLRPHTPQTSDNEVSDSLSSRQRIQKFGIFSPDFGFESFQNQRVHDAMETKMSALRKRESLCMYVS